MTDAGQTSTGHALADPAWLDLHFQAARAEYEASLRHVGVQPGWTVLDAGCGGGGFLPLLGELAGPQGTVVALDLAPENIAHVDSLAGALRPAKLRTQIGSVLALPFDDAMFDCVWCANVAQYLTGAEFARAAAEFRRVLKPGGTLAIKESDSTMFHFAPMPWSVTGRLMVARRAKQAADGVIGGDATSIPSRLRELGLADIRRKGWLVERWGPIAPAVRGFVWELLVHFANAAETYDLSSDDLRLWREAAADPASLLDDPDFCFREGFLLTVGRFPVG